jgi:hypothetical protein
MVTSDSFGATWLQMVQLISQMKLVG